MYITTLVFGEGRGMMRLDNIRCPICGGDISQIGGSLACVSRHTFDIAKSGYVNLNVKGAAAGDSKEMVTARSSFLDAGYYSRFADKLVETVNSMPHGTVIDAGCGEGYYSVRAAKETGSELYGFDLSKAAIEKAAKRAAAANADASFFVGGIFDLPVKSESVDVVLNLFAPCANEEFSRVLKPHGHLIMGIAGENHLLGLKSALYNEVYLNNPEKLAEIDGFTRIKAEKVSYKTVIEGREQIENLFSMTPYYWKTSREDAEKLRELDTLETELDFEIAVFEKN